MSDLLHDLKIYLLAQHIGTETTIFLDFCPDSPDNIIILSEYGGKTGIGADERRVQVRVRNTSYSTAKSTAWSIFNLLDSSEENIVTLGTTRTSVFAAIQPPFKLDEDTRKRVSFANNYRVITTRD